MSIKRKLMTSGVGVIPAEPKPTDDGSSIEPKSDVMITGYGDTMQPGDVVKTRQRDKTKSPYSVVTGINHQTKNVELMNFSDTGVGNRAARRAKFAKEKS